ncbi:2Fe-2S iron-sulfur cluster-binding protein [Gluconacetobacter sacchari]|uniref:Hybrid-cluster NAD(P)-dependent oxidoreductase n=2 Tax=Gluconacetobacter sacchari TaxID=92759 RepID=A0A7W4I983_9PROT|nr:hybrid-cluster NAD(P)-dependent oxidoreductase [Gluconacetobacter sacchari]MBB2158603.1 hybrid-cluster NAD(P)-dependent oxidoreductase [Gluconacetobacter sacchari]
MAIAEVLPPFWDPEHDEVLVCRAVRRQTHDVMTFILTAPQPRRFRYRPGQFMTFTVVIGGVAHHRCYTLSSSPSRPDAVAITVKRVPGGPVSNWLHDHFRPGMEIASLGPAGDFVLDEPRDGAAEKYLFLSAGSGITPVMSMARHRVDTCFDVDAVFLHAARSPDDLIFARELAWMESQAPSLRVRTICEHDTPWRRWAGAMGRIDAALLAREVPDLLERRWFVCGPEGYRRAVRGLAAQSGLDMTRFHEESFDFGELLAQEAELPDPDAASGAVEYTVSFTRSRREIVCGTDTPVLSAARAAGMRLPASCARGMCGTCKCKLLSGTVEMQHDGGIRQREIDQGMILICCARPTSDLVIER